MAHKQTGTNETILPTETQKNTLYALSKRYPVDPLEVRHCMQRMTL